MTHECKNDTYIHRVSDIPIQASNHQFLWRVNGRRRAFSFNKEIPKTPQECTTANEPKGESQIRKDTSWDSRPFCQKSKWNINSQQPWNKDKEKKRFKGGHLYLRHPRFFNQSNNFFVDQVLITSSFVSQARRAVAT